MSVALCSRQVKPCFPPPHCIDKGLGEIVYVKWITLDLFGFSVFVFVNCDKHCVYTIM